jgi:hypothetical protein
MARGELQGRETLDWCPDAFLKGEQKPNAIDMSALRCKHQGGAIVIGGVQSGGVVEIPSNIVRRRTKNSLVKRRMYRYARPERARRRRRGCHGGE